ncbi:MAG: hypothetical protein V4587_17940 [Acidobacteriota bacterium]
MQILYGTAMAAIFILCLALLWTARRILRSSPLTSGGLAFAGLHGAIDPIESSSETDYAEIAQYDLEPEVTEISTRLIDPAVLERISSPIRANAEPMSEPMIAQTYEAMQIVTEIPELPAVEALIDAEELASKPEAKHRGRFSKHLPKGYNYMLEGLLLGISVFVLIRTQRSTWRYHRALQSSDQVA